MPQSYPALLQGHQLTWLGVPPSPWVQPRRVTVVLNEPLSEDSPTAIAEILQR